MWIEALIWESKTIGCYPIHGQLIMQAFEFCSGTRISFGEDTALSVADVLKELGATKVLIVTDGNLLKAGVVEPILASLAEGGFDKPAIFSSVPQDSDVDSVMSAVELGVKHDCDSLIAVGGGSVMDTAKATNICLTYQGDNYEGHLVDYQGLNNLPTKLLPFIAIPTTAGTGSEVSLVAMVMDRREGRKLLFGSPFLAPDRAILDPKLLISLPPRLTAATGLDALTHDIEALVAPIAPSAFVDALALESMKLLFEFLPKATADGSDIEARGKTLVASTMAGLAFTNSGVGIVHALAHSTGAKYGTHHGMTNAVFLPHGMEFNMDVSESRFAHASRYLGFSASSRDGEAADALISAVRNIICDLGLPDRLQDLGVPAPVNGDRQEIALLASTDPAIMFNPKEASLEDIIRIYERAY